VSVTNPTAIKFSNDRIRTAADKLAQAYYHAKQVIYEWYDIEIEPGTTLAAGIPNDGAEQIFDGAESDGRPVISGDDVHNIINRSSELVADYEEFTSVKLNTITKVAVNSGE